jgi:septal ring factor EnvC (AmiA/AmiB activator)
MTKSKGLLKLSLVAVFVAAIGLAGCGGVTDDQLAQLNKLDDEITQLESQVNSLKGEKSKLEREIAEKNAKLEQCAKDKAATQANLQNLPK